MYMYSLWGGMWWAQPVWRQPGAGGPCLGHAWCQGLCQSSREYAAAGGEDKALDQKSARGE